MGSRKNWSAKFEKPTSAPLIALVVIITPQSLLYHVRTFDIVHKTHPSQPIYTFNEHQKKGKEKETNKDKKTQKIGKRNNNNKQTNQHKHTIYIIRILP